MEIPFYKYQGTGNDFVMIDHRKPFLTVTPELVQQLCDRRFGIGADGLILVEEHPEHDFNMIYYNSDGTQSFCGNGSRCTVAFCKMLGMIEKQCVFLSTDGVHEASIDENGIVKLAMHDVKGIEIGSDYHFVHTGSPHYIVFVEDVAQIDVKAKGKAIRYNDRFKAEGTNVNFVQITEKGIKVRTYERGVEDETLSCGTGVTACAIVAQTKGLVKNGVCNVEVMGGNLTVHLQQMEPEHFQNIWLEGPGEPVFNGTYNN